MLLINLVPFAIFQGEIITLDFSLSSMQVRGDDITNRVFSLEAARCGGHCGWEKRRRLKKAADDDDDHDWHKHWNRHVTVVFGSKDEGNILTESRLAQVHSLERKAAEQLGEPWISPLPAFYADYPGSSPKPLETSLVFAAEYVHDTRNRQGDWPFFAKNFSACDPTSPIITAQFFEPGDWEILDYLSSLETDEVYTTFFWDADSWGGGYYGDQRTNQIASDQLIIVGLVIACLILVAVQTRSFFIAAVSLLMILLASVFAFCLYRIFVTPWFGILNACSIFLLLGIACDDIFVVSDSWRQATEVMGIAPDDYAGRLRHMLPRAFPAITTTSLTTAGAFFGNTISSIPPLRLFGLFSGFMVLADLLLTLALLPAVLVLQHRWFGHVNCGFSCLKNESRSPRAVDRLLSQRFAPCVFKLAPFFVLFFAVISSVALNVALEIKPAAQFHESELFPYDHVQQRSYRALQNMAVLEPEYVQASIIYGVVPGDDGDSNQPQSRPHVKWDDNFDIYASGVQEFTAELCNDLLAQRGMVRRLDMCWAQSVRANLKARGLQFPATDRSILDQELNSGGGVSWDRKWVEISFQTNLLATASVAEQRDMYDKFEAFMQKWNAEANSRGLAGLANGFHSSYKWRFMSTIENMAIACIAACCISTGIVFVILLITMQNLVVVGLIILHVMAVCITLIAFFVLEGRSLGVIESVTATLLVGLSVDYLVHVGSAYLDQPETTPRGERTLRALSHIGGSVLAACATSLLSAVCLCFATITFFVAFGKFVIGMVCLSVIFTLVSLASSLYLFGPERSCGSLRSCCRRSRVTDSVQPETAEDGSTNFLTDTVKLEPASRRTQLLTAASALIVLVVGIAIRLALSLSTQPVEAPVCPTLTELEFTFNEYAIPSEQDSYRCRDYDKIPAGCTYYITEWEPIVTEGMLGTVHHMILFATETTKSTCPYTCFDMPNAIGMDAGWAVGGGNVKFPSGVSLPIGGQKHALQMHYYNPLLSNSLVDTRSGIKLKLTSTPPSVGSLTNLIIGLHPLGALEIQPGVENKTVYAECIPQITGPVTVLAHAPHAHKLGFSIFTEVRRQTAFGIQKVGDVGNDPYYTFDNQRIQMFSPGEERLLQPGDAIRVICSYRSTSRTEWTHSGWGSEDEMCMTIIYAYPSQNVDSRNCLTQTTFEL
eukprot:TRINITY_DN16141_c0_g3_i1.p1 TRINITY_DN16141_c0_g3~~TRINITY_DN16141_c0_g3_i1.p1  ORF type:complete len:1263 (-),score=174.17 TRINITY_DN16141_c0_g3_i1:157-3672(-)